MVERNEKREFVTVCDGCQWKTEVPRGAGFKGLLAHAKDIGWVFQKINESWGHFCPLC